MESKEGEVLTNATRDYIKIELKEIGNVAERTIIIQSSRANYVNHLKNEGFDSLKKGQRIAVDALNKGTDTLFWLTNKSTFHVIQE